MQRSPLFSYRSLFSVPNLFIFQKDRFPQLSLDNATPYRKVSTGSREVNSCHWDPFRKGGQHPLIAACLFSLDAWVCSGHSEEPGPPESPGCPSLLSRPVAATASPWQPLECSDCQVKGSLAKETEISCFALVSPRLSKVSIVLERVTIWLFRKRELYALCTAWNRCDC